jgi:hypothetical protein
MVAAQTAGGSITVFELLGCEEVNPGEIVEGYLNEFDNQDIFNQTQDEKMRVFVHEHGRKLDDVVARYFSTLTAYAHPRRPMWPGSLNPPAFQRPAFQPRS